MEIWLSLTCTRKYVHMYALKYAHSKLKWQKLALSQFRSPGWPSEWDRSKRTFKPFFKRLFKRKKIKELSRMQSLLWIAILLCKNGNWIIITFQYSWLNCHKSEWNCMQKSLKHLFSNHIPIYSFYHSFILQVFKELTYCSLSPENLAFPPSNSTVESANSSKNLLAGSVMVYYLFCTYATLAVAGLQERGGGAPLAKHY